MPSRVQFRNPYPVPDVSSEGFWLPPGPILGEKVTIDDRRWSTKLEIHERLFAHHTLNSIRRDQRFVRTKAPNDALDLALTSAYAHNEDTLVPKMYVSMQPESLGRETWRVLRNELKTSSPQFGIPTDSGQNGESPESKEDATIEQEYDYETTKMSTGIKMSGGIKMAVGTKMVSGTKMVAGIKMSSGTKTGTGTKMVLGSKTGAGIKMSSSGKTGAGNKIVQGSKTGTGVKMSLGTKTAAGNKMALGSKMAARAISAPTRSSHNNQGGLPPTLQLHKYAGRTRHDGIPDRIERIHPSSLKLGIGGPHTDQTKAGYSRKDDGTFYGV